MPKTGAKPNKARAKPRPKPQSGGPRPKGNPVVQRNNPRARGPPKHLPSVSAAAAKYVAARLYPRFGVGAKIPDKHNGLTASIQSFTTTTFTCANGFANICIQPRNPNLLYGIKSDVNSLPTLNTAAADYATWSPLVQTTRVVSCEARVVVNYSATEKPGISFCRQLAANENLPSPNTVMSSNGTHSEELSDGCYALYEPTYGNIDPNVFLNIGDLGVLYDRMIICIQNASTTASFTLEIRVNYEVTPISLAEGVLSAEVSPTIPGLVDKVDRMAAVVPRYATAKAAERYHGTTPKVGGIVDAAAQLANAVGNSLPGFAGGLVKGAGSLLKSIFG